jgi:hypothetical protein
VSLLGLPDAPAGQQSVTVHLPAKNLFKADALARMVKKAENGEPLA